MVLGVPANVFLVFVVYPKMAILLGFKGVLLKPLEICIYVKVSKVVFTHRQGANGKEGMQADDDRRQHYRDVLTEAGVLNLC